MDVFCGKIMDKVKLVWSKTNRWHRAFLLLFLVELKIFPSGQIGFTCKDPALSHPFTGDTVSWKLLLATCILLPLVIILIVERKYNVDKSVNPKQLALFWYREHLFGVLVNLVTVQVLKSIVGSPRPHFFDTCSPKEALTCQDSEYVDSYTCTKAHWLSQSDRSFPSGHTSLAIHTGFLLAYYLQRRIIPRSSGVVSAQVVLLLTAVYCGVSRITDHRHHWWDVVAGVVLAAPILVYTVLYSCSNFECPAANVDKEQSDGLILNNTETVEARTT
uniref:Wunen-like protein 1 n=1 Tax=Manduca sexta TaxID=7130 RepID=A0A517BE95_MANSE|nr:wunen-like protein 1 [Manduca sexta]